MTHDGFSEKIGERGVQEQVKGDRVERKSTNMVETESGRQGE